MDDVVDEPQASGTEDNDPFSPNNVGKVQLIVLMRIYDVLMAQLGKDHPEAAEALNDIHSNGKILGSLPYLDLSEDS